ncbi:3-deoxy-D-manno-octulosonic acid transferase [Gemmobacter fulvus]|uniref:3-deoxy-D-manno-octulosonic acid transferase n=1 Tax=Gemmobacter fulvus TaxID=2840474 RepID=A0A975S1X7_9RHOB|nr:glycosyltransferase N-terminal domain-containing protein [Gemmobacter fulvus]MBT9244168.1 3-deoxy-D-manno-octulosonic acid transferase [Gemmobacter fulvus]QWK91072.1 3-deoxy-D-manno-octulosonic acid transferase [Gemmobacter fulvus]
MKLYRTALRLALPLLVGMTVWHRWRGRQGPGAVAERLGLAAGTDADLWLHGASNGELTSARWLIAQILAARPALRLIITCNTASARAMVAGWGLERVQARLAPFDSKGSVARFLARWQPRALIMLENELWPERIAQAAARGPVICLGARLSEGSARNWARVAPRLIGDTLRRFALISAQDAGSEARLVGLGLPQTRLGPRLMLKSRAATMEAPTAAVPPFAAPVARARILLAASTHEGEEAVILAGFAAARAAGAFDLLILAPRHPRRSAQVAALIAAEGLPCAIRSTGAVPGPEVAVYLADTLGEMAHWYAMAGATVIGGTFSDAGGHTPFEPAAFGSALLHGPSVANFAEVFAALDAAGAAVPVADAAGLATALCGLDAAEQARRAALASDVLRPQEDEAALWQVLEPLLPQPSG